MTTVKSIFGLVALWAGTIYSYEVSILMCNILTGVAVGVTVMAIIYYIYNLGYKDCAEEFINEDVPVTPKFETLPPHIQHFILEQKRKEHHNK